MRLRTQLFLGTAALVFSLVGIQWWLQIGQLKAIERELTEVAADVGETIIYTGLIYPGEKSQPSDTGETAVHKRPFLKIKAEEMVFKQVHTTRKDTNSVVEKHSVRQRPPDSKSGDETEKKEENKTNIWIQSSMDGEEHQVEKIITASKIKVTAGTDGEHRFLLITGMPGGEKRIPIPISRSKEIVRKTLNQGLFAGIAFLIVGFLGAAVMAHRVTQPLRRMVVGVEALGRGDLGAQVPVTARGEIGELQSTFNHMSTQLVELEKEKESWKAREHLAELGGLARGLAHTLRNPLNTLGLIVGELAGKAKEGGDELVHSARVQIRRIDRWLCSFLAMDAEGVARPEEADLSKLVGDLVFEAVQGGGRVEVRGGDTPLKASIVAPALRSALANLIENALDASPEGAPVVVHMSQEDETIVIRIIDKGPGLPDEVKSRLFDPHVTTKTGGSGMGIFLAKQLIEGVHGGRLDIGDTAEGGTVAEVVVPIQSQICTDEATS